MGKLQKMRKKNKIYSLGKIIADSNILDSRDSTFRWKGRRQHTRI